MYVQFVNTDSGKVGDDLSDPSATIDSSKLLSNVNSVVFGKYCSMGSFHISASS